MEMKLTRADTRRPSEGNVNLETGAAVSKEGGGLSVEDRPKKGSAVMTVDSSEGF
jgi:hypothetical protein